MADWSDYDTPRMKGYIWSNYDYIPPSRKIIVTPINWPTNNPLLKIKEDYKVELMKKDLVIPPQPLSEEERDKYLKEMAKLSENKPAYPKKIDRDDILNFDWDYWYPDK